MNLFAPVHYILRDRKVVPVRDVMTWARWFENADRKVALTKFPEQGVTVSTVFIGLDHGHGRGPPLVFETMVFGGPLDQYQERCSTWEQAERMHQRVCDRFTGANVEPMRKAK